MGRGPAFLALLLAAVACATPGRSAAASPDPAASFPTALDPAAVNDWLGRETGATPDQVIAISPSAVTRLVAASPAGPSRWRVVVEAQALTREAADRSGVLAWRMTLEVDCASGRVRPGPTTGYWSRAASGPGVPLQPGETNWREPAAGTQLDGIRRATCERRPAPAVKAAMADATSTAREAPAPPPAPPAAPPPRSSNPAPPHGRSNVVAQVIGTPDMSEAAATLGRLQNRFGALLNGLEARVVPAEVSGRTVYRGLVSGFADRGAAKAFCERLKSERRSCFLRQAPAADRPLKPVATR